MSGSRIFLMVKIFISYRHADTIHIVGRIHADLVKKFGKKNVFKDVDSIPLGSDFRHILGEAVNRCDVLLTVIGKGWLEAADPAGKRRLEAKNDFVRVEVEAALERGILVIPLLVDGASVPSAEELPESLRNLSFRSGIPIRNDPDYSNDMFKLVAALKRPQQARTQAVAKQASRSKPPVRILGMVVLLLGFLVVGIGCAYLGGWLNDSVIEQQKQVNARFPEGHAAPPAQGPAIGSPRPPSATNAPIPPQPVPSNAIDRTLAGEAELAELFARMPQLNDSNQGINVGLWIATPITRADVPIFNSLMESMQEAGARIHTVASEPVARISGLGNRVFQSVNFLDLMDKPQIDSVIIYGYDGNQTAILSFTRDQVAMPFKVANDALVVCSQAGHDSFLIVPAYGTFGEKPDQPEQNPLSNRTAAYETLLAARKFNRIVCVGNQARGNDFSEFFRSVKSRQPGPSDITRLLK